MNKSVGIFFCLILLVGTLGGCGSTGPETHSDARDGFEGDANRFIDWDAEDWKFPRHALVSAYMFEQSPPSSSADVYLQNTRYKGPVAATSLQEFRQLSPADQKVRRKAAANYLDDAMAFYRVLLRGWEIWIMGRKAAVPKEAFRYENGLITHTIQNLNTAAGLDPANPYTWQHLAFFTGLVGDRTGQRHALNLTLELIDDEAENDLPLVRLRMILDRGWLNRETGRFDEAFADAQQAIDLMAHDQMRTLDLAREGVLLKALAMVDRGEIFEARTLAKELDGWKVPLQKTPAQSATSAATVLDKRSLQMVESDFGRQWVWAMTYLKLDDQALALGFFNRQKWSLEFPPHLNYRFWQDIGRVQEHFGQHDDARISYAFSILNRPFLPYYPLAGAKGLSRIFSQVGCGHTYYLGYGSFFLAGSYFSYAANRVISLEIAPTVDEISRRARVAIEALSICVDQGIRPASSLALRGRVQYRMGQFAEAENDLQLADEVFMAEGRESSDVVKLLAVLHFDRKDYQGCLSLLARYNTLEPRDGFGWRLSGLALAHLNRQDEALEYLDVALDVDPQSAPGWYNRAVVNLQVGNRDRARQDLEYARRLWPENQEILRVSTLIQDNPDTPISLTSGTVDLRISREDSLVFAMTDRTSPADLTHNIEKDQLEKLLENFREDYEASPSRQQRLTLARGLIQSGQYRQTQELLLPFWPHELSRDETELLLKADRALGQPRRAVVLARSLVRDPAPVTDSDFWALVAIICLENGAPDSGQMALDAALALDPQNVALLRLKYSPSP